MNEIKKTCQLTEVIKRSGEIPSHEKTGEKISKLKNELVFKNEIIAEEGHFKQSKIEFKGNYESSMREVRYHGDKARRYEREANQLESDIRRGKVAKNEMSKVKELRNKAEREKREETRAKEYAKRALMSK